MTACYIGEGLEQRRASFELFVRQLPTGFGYLIAMGLAQALDYLESSVSAQLSWLLLQATGILRTPDRFWQMLARRVYGRCWAVRRYSYFAGEPLLRVEAPLLQAQLVETC